MPPGSGAGWLALGPIVGHTDHLSSRIWIQVLDDPDNYALQVQGVGLFRFFSTEAPGPLEFRTAVAVAVGLRPDWRYRYRVLRRRGALAGARGGFRTMPDPDSMANLTFCVVSCSKTEKEGEWQTLGRFVAERQPHFILMIGDQLYLDEDGIDVFAQHRFSPAPVRRQAIAEKYRLNWSRESVRAVFANVPVYMLWDDHDIRDGWGSVASDSLTMAARHKRGRDVFKGCNTYFEDCRDAYWHFQACRNPRPNDGVDPALPNYVDGLPPPDARQAMPYAFRCGRLVVLMLDSRGERDVFRAELPILGATQWAFIDHVFANLADTVDALAVVTPTPIASIDPDGQVMRLMGDRTDDVEAFKRGADPPGSEGGWWEGAKTIANPTLSRLVHRQLNIGSFKISNLDEARDQWSHKYSRPEQVRLLRAAGKARLANRAPGTARGLVFLSGDIHVGARFTIDCADPPYQALSLTASGISTVYGDQPIIDVILSRELAVAPGIRSTLKEVVTEFNFGVLEVVPTGRGAEIQGAIAHSGNSFALGANIRALV